MVTRRSGGGRRGPLVCAHHQAPVVVAVCLTLADMDVYPDARRQRRGPDGGAGRGDGGAEHPRRRPCRGPRRLLDVRAALLPGRGRRARGAVALAGTGIGDPGRARKQGQAAGAPAGGRSPAARYEGCLPRRRGGRRQAGLRPRARLPPEDLTVVVNTGDDFDHLGLRICPDLDTVTYTLAGLANPETGWGRSDETWNFLDALERLGADTWFRLGDRDLATHVERRRRLAAGETLTEVTQALCRALRVGAAAAADDGRSGLRTVVQTDEGELEVPGIFCAPAVPPASHAVSAL